MKKRDTLVLVLFILILLISSTACVHNADTSEPDPTATPATSAPEPRLTEDEEEILRIMAAGRQFVAELQSGVQPTNARDERTDDAVVALERFFRLDTLYVSGVFMDPNMPENYTCMISGLNEFNYARSVKIIFSRSEPMTWYCPVVNYSAYSDRAVEIYLGYLRDNDPEGLARWLHEGEAPAQATVEAAEKTVDYYQRHYDLSATSVREVDLLDAGFVFTIGDAANRTFQIELYYGDGLCFPRLLNDEQLE